MPFDGTLEVYLADVLGIYGDVFELFVDGVSLGFTGPARYSIPSFGWFSVDLKSGAHTYDINDQSLSRIGFRNLYGQIVPGPYPFPARVYAKGTAVPAVPEPSSAALLAVGGVAFALVRRRRSQK